MRSFAVGMSAFVLASFGWAQEPGALARGEQLLKALAPPTAGTTDARHFEILLAERPSGYAVITLETRKEAAGTVYGYLHELVMKLPDGKKVETQIAGTLRADFLPLELRVQRKIAGARGARTSTRTLKLQGEKLQLTEDEDGEISEQTVALPASTVVHLLEVLIPRLIKGPQDPFALRTVSTETGTVQEVAVSTSVLPDGACRVSCDSPVGTEYYLLDAAGALAEFGYPDAGIAGRRCAPDRVAQIKAELAK